MCPASVVELRVLPAHTRSNSSDSWPAQHPRQDELQHGLLSALSHVAAEVP